MKGVLKDDLDIREISGTGFVQANIIFPSLMKLSPAIRSQQTISLVKVKIGFYMSLKTNFLLRTTL